MITTLTTIATTITIMIMIMIVILNNHNRSQNRPNRPNRTLRPLALDPWLPSRPMTIGPWPCHYRDPRTLWPRGHGPRPSTDGPVAHGPRPLAFSSQHLASASASGIQLLITALMALAALWPYGLMALWLSWPSRPYGLMALWPYGLVALWPPDLNSLLGLQPLAFGFQPRLSAYTALRLPTQGPRPKGVTRKNASSDCQSI